jgi:hypothetical protein
VEEASKKKGKKATDAPAAGPAAPPAGGILDPSASAFAALDAWERKKAIAAGLEVGPGRICSLRHRIPFTSRDEGSRCVK